MCQYLEYNVMNGPDPLFMDYMYIHVHVRICTVGYYTTGTLCVHAYMQEIDFCKLHRDNYTFFFFSFFQTPISHFWS